MPDTTVHKQRINESNKFLYNCTVTVHKPFLASRVATLISIQVLIPYCVVESMYVITNSKHQNFSWLTNGTGAVAEVVYYQVL